LSAEAQAGLPEPFSVQVTPFPPGAPTAGGDFLLPGEEYPAQGFALAPDVRVVYLSESLPISTTVSSTLSMTGSFGLITKIPASGKFLALTDEFGPGDSERRSNITVSLPIQGGNGRQGGRLELSEGPAYGWAIVTSVTRAWAAASSIAVLLAAGAGWFISRRVTLPL
jgi:hypothetical protein